MQKAPEAMEIAEASREKQRHKGYIADLFRGQNNFSLLYPFPKENFVEKLNSERWFADFADLLKSVDANDIDKTGEIPDELINKLRELTAFGLKIPQEYGGLGLSQSEYRRLAVLLGSRCANLSALLSAHNSLGATLPLMKYGTNEQKNKWLPRLAKGDISAFALTEEEVGSDPASMTTYAMRLYNEFGEVDGYGIHGKKLWTTNAVKNKGESLAKVVVVVARIVDDPSEINDPEAKKCFGLFLVDTTKPGFKVLHRCRFMGLRAIYNGVVEFDVMVPAENRIGNEGDGFKIAMQILTIGRLTVPALCLGGLKQLLRGARWWGKKRIQWGKPIGEHELIGEKIVDTACRALVLEAITKYCANLVDHNKDARIESVASKVIGSDYLFYAANDLFRIRGGRGFETYDSLKERGEVPFPVEQFMRDNPINRTFEGANELMHLWTGREGLNDLMTHGLKLTGKKTSMLSKLNSLAWLGGQFIKTFLPSISSAPKEVKIVFNRHLRFINREAKRLLRHSLIISGRYQTSLEKKQLVVAELVRRAFSLFEMSCAISYAMSCKNKPLALQLTDYFCWKKREELYPRGFVRWALFGSHKNVYKLAKQIMEGEAVWLEEGIIPFDFEAQLPKTETPQEAECCFDQETD